MRSEKSSEVHLKRDNRFWKGPSFGSKHDYDKEPIKSAQIIIIIIIEG